MFRVSVILKNAREDKELNYQDISKKLKVPAKYLEAIENEQIKDFPPDPYCSLIIKDYANFLGLNGDDILSLFRRDFDRKTKNKPNNISEIHLTPQFTFKVGILVAIIAFIAYLTYEYIKFNQPPPLKVNWPSSDSIVDQSLEITGSTDSEATVKINDDLIIIDSSGNFRKEIVFTSPTMKITVESTSVNGKINQDQKEYILEADKFKN